MRAFVSRWTFTGVAMLSLGLSAIGCKTTPWSSSGSLASWGKKDGALAATKPSANYPLPPSKNSTPNPTATAATGYGGRPANGGVGANGNPNSGYPLNANSGSSPYGGNSAYGGGRSGADPMAGGGGQSEHGFYSAVPPGGNGGAGQPAPNSGYAGGTNIPRGGFDYETADRRNGAAGTGGYGAAPAGGFAGPGTGGYGGPGAGSDNGYPAADPGGGVQRNPYASPAGYTPKSARAPAYGAPGHEGHDHDHDHGEFTPPDSYGSPRKPASSYDAGGAGSFTPSGSSTYGGGLGSKSADQPAAAGLSQRGTGYTPGSTRRGLSQPSALSSTPESFEADSDVKPAGFNNPAASGGELPVEDDDSGGSFSEPDDADSDSFSMPQGR